MPCAQKWMRSNEAPPPAGVQYALPRIKSQSQAQKLNNLGLHVGYTSRHLLDMRANRARPQCYTAGDAESLQLRVYNQNPALHLLQCVAAQPRRPQPQSRWCQPRRGKSTTPDFVAGSTTSALNNPGIVPAGFPSTQSASASEPQESSSSSRSAALRSLMGL